jgi:polyhydroxyalkanoate synthesis regulator protein
MEMFERAFAMFTPFARRESQGGAEPERGTQQGASGDEIHDLKRQLEEVQKRLERLTDKDEKDKA